MHFPLYLSSKGLLKKPFPSYLKSLCSCSLSGLLLLQKHPIVLLFSLILLAGASEKKQMNIKQKSVTKPHRSWLSNSSNFTSFPENGGTFREEKLNFPMYHLKLENKTTPTLKQDLKLLLPQLTHIIKN